VYRLATHPLRCSPLPLARGARLFRDAYTACTKVAQYLTRYGDRILLHYVPNRCPTCKPIEALS
jgi:hypothetical protein